MHHKINPKFTKIDLGFQNVSFHVIKKEVNLFELWTSKTEDKPINEVTDTFLKGLV